MAAPRRRADRSILSSDEPAPKRPAVSRSSSADHHPLLSRPPASAVGQGRRPPICAGRFASSLHFSPKPGFINATNRQARTAPDDAHGAFTRGALAKTLVRQHRASGYVPAPAADQLPRRPGRHALRSDDEITAQRIGILGAGMAGLYSALILDSLGFNNYEILEANPDRVGGRVFTHYFEDIPGKANQWNYIDFGAMRFPSIAIMDRVIGKKQPWSLVNYLNSHVEEDRKITLIDYHLSVDNNIQYYNSTRKTNAELDKAGPDPLHFGKSNGGGLDDKYVQEWYTTWLDPAFDGFKESLHTDFNTGFQALMKYDHFSVRAYLRTLKGPDKSMYSQELIDYLETLDSATGHYDDALSEAVMDSFDFDSPADSPDGSVQWRCIRGGTSQLALGMLSILISKPKMSKRVTKIAPSRMVSNQSRAKIDVFVANETHPRSYRHVINTLPPAVVRSLDTAECNFSYAKRTALRVLHVDSSLKVGLLFKTRWWQDEEVMRGKAMRGGQSSTDLPVRTIVYPSYGIDDADAPGVLIASYPWGQDAARLSALAGAGEPAGMALVELSMSNIATVHDLPMSFLQAQFTGQYFIQDWDQDEHSQGAFALFGPGQFASLFPALTAPEMDGHYHTAGEMSSVHHAWIVGALNSAWRCVYEILHSNGATQKIAELKEKWGEVDEVEMGDLVS